VVPYYRRRDLANFAGSVILRMVRLWVRDRRGIGLQVTNLFVKAGHGVAMRPVTAISHSPEGIQGNVSCAPFRQVLIASQAITAECGLRPGDLRENVVVNCDRLYDLPSGTVVRIGRAKVRLTFHCEPCKNILKLIDFDRIEHKRGYLGSFLDSGTISLGDEFAITDEQMEPIPYGVHERINWFLQNHGLSAAATDLVHKIGLPSTAAKLIARVQKRQIEPA
jgi:MOSC domain-containing protein YiiM